MTLPNCLNKNGFFSLFIETSHIFASEIKKRVNINLINLKVMCDNSENDYD